MTVKDEPTIVSLLRDQPFAEECTKCQKTYEKVANAITSNPQFIIPYDLLIFFAEDGQLHVATVEMEGDGKYSIVHGDEDISMDMLAKIYQLKDVEVTPLG